MSLTRRLARTPRPVAFWAAAGASLIIAHDAVFLVQVGPGEPLARALRGGGHGYWAAASTVLAGIAILVTLTLVVRLAVLGRRARTLAAAAPDGRSRRSAVAGRLWLRLLVTVAVGFALQENVEHLAAHDHFMGLAALHGPEYPLALPVLAVVTGVVALAGAAVLGIERDLVAAIRAALRRPWRPRSADAAPRPPRAATLPHRHAMAGHRAVRAPPSMLVSASIA